MRIFITGATGVLGKRVVKRLLAKNYPVAALSRSYENFKEGFRKIIDA